MFSWDLTKKELVLQLSRALDESRDLKVLYLVTEREERKGCPNGK